MSVQREFEQDEIADAIHETRAGHFGPAPDVNPPGSVCEVEVIAGRKPKRGFLADLAQYLEVILAAVRHVISWWIRDAIEQLLSSTLQGLQLRLGFQKSRLLSLQRG